MLESMIRPQHIFEEYLRLAAIDAHTYFFNSSSHSTNCPACNQPGQFAFEKSAFTYELCGFCDTLYVSPRPVASAFQRYYTEAPSVNFWATTFYSKTASQRRKFVWEPKAQMIHELIHKYQQTAEVLVDIGAGYGIFSDVFSALSNLDCILIEPSPRLAEICRSRGHVVLQSFLEGLTRDSLSPKHSIFVCFELFEHLHDPSKFLSFVFNLLKPGELFIFSTLSSTGLDIQCLWENSKSVSPPHHLNFFNPKSIQLLLDRLGFKCLEVSTPGKLDINILQSNHSLIKDRFWKTVIANIPSTDYAETLQTMIASAGLSSHMLVVCCRQ
jgi:SAM-dependent methyltransferase